MDACDHASVTVHSDTIGQCSACGAFVPLETLYYRNGATFHIKAVGTDERYPSHPANNPDWVKSSPGIWKEVA